MATDQAYQSGFAIGLQAAKGTVLASVRDLSGALALSDGIVYGHRGAGVLGDGITPPTFGANREDRPQVAASFTEQSAAFQNETASGFKFSWLVQGNGLAEGAPDAGKARPGDGTANTDDLGLDALYQCCGLAGADGASPKYDYTPARNASASGASPYCTIKLWIGTFSYVFVDVLVSKCSFVVTPGGHCIAEAEFEIGLWDQATHFASNVTFPSAFVYGNYASVNPARAVSMDYTHATARDFVSMNLSINNAIERLERSNTATGNTVNQNVRRIVMDAAVLIDATTPATTDIIEQADLIRTAAPTVDIGFHVGTVGVTAAMEAVEFDFNNVQVNDVQPEASGKNSMIQNLSMLATGVTAGSEFTLTFS